MKWNTPLGLFSLSLGLSCSVHAAYVIDVYGTHPKNTQRITQQYTKQIADIENAIQNELANPKPEHGKQHTQQSHLMKKFFQKRALEAKIKQEFGFLWVSIESVFYPDKTDLYTTVEVIDPDQPERLRFITPSTQAFKKSAPIKHDLVEDMINYERKVFERTLTRKLNKTPVHCPVYHCLIGFDYPELKPYLSQFNQGVLKERKLILKTIRQDLDSQRREAALFLLGHFKDPHDILRISSHYVQDKDETVRNAAMRVIAATMESAKIYETNLKPIMALLDSPKLTDRNKALYILDIAVMAKKNQHIIRQACTKQLIQMLQLKQPNNHDLAYHILKALSHKTWPEDNLAAWEHWSHQQNHNMTQHV